MSAHEYFPADHLVGRAVVDTGFPGELLAAFWAAEVASRAVFRYSVRETFDQLAAAFLSVAVEQGRAARAMNRDHEELHFPFRHGRFSRQ